MKNITAITAAALLLAAAASPAATYEIGRTGNTSDYPFNGCWGVEEERSQELVLRTDAVPAGRITKWEWFFSNVLTTGRLDNFSLKLCHTTRTALTSTYADNYAGNSPVQVYYRAQAGITPRSNEWFGFDFDTSFPYDGARNLIVELRWKTGTETRAYTHSTVVASRFVVSYVENGTPKYGYPNAGQVRDEQHYMRLTVTAAAASPTSLGRVKALFR